jgi:[ribosomal protein S5]-alanine N-acetyltransferase
MNPTPPCTQIATARLRLTPLAPRDADAMFAVLADPAIYRYLDYGPPASIAELRSLYERQARGVSADGRQRWLNWIVRDAADGTPLGFVQATALADASAYVAYVLAPQHWGKGYASEALGAMMQRLESCNVTTFLASVEIANRRSIELLVRLGFVDATVIHPAAARLGPTERLYARSFAGASGSSSTP